MLLFIFSTIYDNIHVPVYVTIHDLSLLPPSLPPFLSPSLPPFLSLSLPPSLPPSSYNYSMGLAGHTVPCGDGKDSAVAICQHSLNDSSNYVIARSNGTLKVIDGKVRSKAVW